MDIRFDRLVELANYLRNISEDKWYYLQIIKGVATIDDRDNLCCTSGCALGHCTNIWPDYWKMYKLPGGEIQFETPIAISQMYDDEHLSNNCHFQLPDGETRSSYSSMTNASEAAKDFFNLNGHQVDWIFFDDYMIYDIEGYNPSVDQPTPKMVADRIDEFVASGGTRYDIYGDDE